MRIFPLALHALVAAGAVLVLPGCGSSPRPVTNEKSAGTQLIELKDARDKGLITEKEYERMRKRIVRDHD